MNLRHLTVLFALFLPVAAFAQNAAVQTALDHVTTNHEAFGLTEADVSDIAVTDAYTSRRSGTTHVYLRQRHEGIEIADANITVNVDRNGEIFHLGGSFQADIANRIAANAPALPAAAAAEALAADVGLSPTEPFVVVETEGGPSQAVVLSDGGIAQEPIPAHLVYHARDVGEVGHPPGIYLAWEIGIYELNAHHYWLGRVDASDAHVLALQDLVVKDVWVSEHLIQNTKPRPRREQTQAMYAIAPMAPTAAVNDYRVFAVPVEAPTYATSPPPADGRTIETDPAETVSASPFGWHDTDGSAGNEFTTTQGNNTHAYLDRNGNNLPDAGSGPDCGPSIICDFDFPIDFGTEVPVTYGDAAVTNLFYWTNVIHDVMFQYGFDSPAGNFQFNTYGQGGIGGDEVLAEAQDGADIGADCNAFFFTPVDGSNGRMEQLECDIASPTRDADFDNPVIMHEFGHGIARRLVGGPNNVSCFGHAEQMGEGISDYLGLLLTIDVGDTGPDSRGIGDYLFGQGAGGSGIRPHPYSTNFAINHETHCDINAHSTGAHDGPGFTWASIIWQVTWEMINVYGFDPDIWDATSGAGNNVMFQVVTEGMKLVPCSPGFVDMRDGILQADINIYGGIHLFELWEGFATRGLGELATQGSTNNQNDNTCDFNNPIPVELVAFTSSADGNDVVLNWATSSETNNAGFEVQHRVEGGPYEVLGFVEGHGTTTEEQTYSYRAEGLDVGIHTFRLKQIDFDGAFELSQEVEVAVGVVGTHVLSEVYPNPFNPQAQFTLAVGSHQSVSITVYDVVGRQVATLHDGILEANEPYQFTIDGSGLASGAYFIRIVGETFTNTRRITLLK